MPVAEPGKRPEEESLQIFLLPFFLNPPQVAFLTHDTGLQSIGVTLHGMDS